VGVEAVAGKVQEQVEPVVMAQMAIGKQEIAGLLASVGEIMVFTPVQVAAEEVVVVVMPD